MSDSDGHGDKAVSLGCGTLIIIALIVVFLGRPDLGPLENEIVGLREEIYDLREEVTTLNTQVNLLRSEVLALRDESQLSDAVIIDEESREHEAPNGN